MILQKTEKFTLSRLNNIQLLRDLDENTRNIMRQYLDVEAEYRYALREMSAKLENLDDYCQRHFDHNPIHHMESRIKTPESILEKMERREYDMDFQSLRKNVYDIAGIRVICNYINDIYQIINLLCQQRDLSIQVQKDYIVSPKPTGYRSLHIVFDVELYLNGVIKKVPVEIQFRTIAMDMWASLEHELRYKSHNNLSDEEKNNLKTYSDTLYNIDLNMQRIYISNTVGFGGGKKEDD